MALASDVAKGTIAISEERGVRTLQFGPHWIQGAMRISQPNALELDYTRAMMAALLLVPRPRSVLMIGLGAGSLAKFLYHHFVDVRITVVEIDPKVVGVAREYFYLPDDPLRLSIELADGFEFVQTCKRQFDLVFVDGFDHNGRAGPLESLPFYLACRACRACLAPRGLAVINLLGRTRGFKAAARRIDDAFARRVVSLPQCEGGNLIFFGLRTPLTRLTEPGLRARAAALHAETNLDVAFTIPKLCRKGSGVWESTA